MSVQTSTESGRVPRHAGWLTLLPLLALAWPAAAATTTTPPGAFADRPAALRAGSAEPARRGDAARSLADRQISMDEAVDLAQRRYNARVVRAEVSERGGRRVYLLRLLSDDGRVFNVRVDAATGSIQ
jgi:hypothetical protein